MRRSSTTTRASWRRSIGRSPTGIINNYYWARLRAEKGPDKMKSAIHRFGGGDVGGLVKSPAPPR